MFCRFMALCATPLGTMRLCITIALSIVSALFVSAMLLPANAHAKAFSPMLLSEFHSESITQDELDSQMWLVSEKLDGVRGLWDGERMYFRSGKPLSLPKDFTHGFPPFCLDGELYSPKLHFSQIISILKNPAKSKEILELRFYVFDVPCAVDSGLQARLKILEEYLKSHAAPHIAIIPQSPLQSLKALQAKLEDITQKGGEGLVIRAAFLPYQSGRSKKDFKLKKSKDSECEVIGYSPGKGKYEGMVGAIICQWGDKSFKIGSGLSDELRHNPPPLGSMVSFKYHELTHNGIPRFPRFWRVRESE